MKISLYYPWIYLKGGGERVMIELIKRSRHQWIIYTNHYDKKNSFPEISKFNVVELKNVSVKRDIKEVFKAIIQLSRQALPEDNSGARCVLIDSIGSFMNMRNHDRPVFGICLTPLRLAYDELYWENYISQKNKRDSLALNLSRFIFRVFDKPAWKYYGRVFCISNEVKRRIIHGGILNEDKLSVAYPGVNLDFYKPLENAASGKYFFLPSRIMWTKNIELAIDAFKIFYGKNKDFELYIAGIVDEKSQAYFEALKKKAGGLPVKFITEISDEEMLKMYRKCFAVLFTAFNEDWGFIPLEAMACGKPVIAVNRGGPTESIINRQTGMLAEPDPSAFSNAMRELAGNNELRERIIKSGPEHVKKFSWQNFVEPIDNYIDSLAQR